MARKEMLDVTGFPKLKTLFPIVIDTAINRAPDIADLTADDRDQWTVVSDQTFRVRLPISINRFDTIKQ